MSLLTTVSTLLRSRDIPHALIGAAALATHGVSRATLDQDLLVIDRAVLGRGFWADQQTEVIVDIRHGDDEDPLAGVVRIRASGERDIDIVVGKHLWQADVLRRAVAGPEDDAPVVQAADLVLLKLFAGGSQDRWDIEQLLALDTRGAVRELVDTDVPQLPSDARELWAQVREQVR